MFLKRLKLKNYRLFSDVDISFQRGMNVLIGKNSTGKSTVLEAINFLLSNNNANIPPDEIVPYDKRNQQTVQSRIDGFFEMSDLEKDDMCSILTNDNEIEQIKNTHMEIYFSKAINKSGRNVRVIPNIQINGNGISRNTNLLNKIINLLLPKLQTSNVLKITDTEMNDSLPMRPLNELAHLVTQQSAYLNQYLRNTLYDIKQSSIGEFNKIKNEVMKAYMEMSDMDVEFDAKRAQVQIYFKTNNNDVKIPLESEGWGIREYFYLLLTLRNYPDTIILKDEALTHLHKALLNDFILSIDGLKYQMLTTSHIKELIRSLDFANIIICRKCEGVTTVKNLMEFDEINKVFDELGYSIDSIPEIDSLFNDK
jgi:predicted ATP-dependent endonuclease of OLD family